MTLYLPIKKKVSFRDQKLKRWAWYIHCPSFTLSYLQLFFITFEPDCASVSLAHFTVVSTSPGSRHALTKNLAKDNSNESQNSKEWQPKPQNTSEAVSKWHSSITLGEITNIVNSEMLTAKEDSAASPEQSSLAEKAKCSRVACSPVRGMLPGRQ